MWLPTTIRTVYNPETFSSFHRKTLHLERHFRDMFTNANLYKQLWVTGEKINLAREFRKHVNTPNGSEIGCYFTTTRSKWRRMNHSLRMTWHCQSVRSGWAIHSEWHSVLPLSTVGHSASGLSTQSSTPIKWLMRNGWKGCGCIPYRIPLTLKPVFTTAAAVKENKWICSNNDFIPKRVAV